MKSWLRYLKDWAYVILGALVYKLTGRNKEFSYQAMIRLYCRTQGRSTAYIWKFIQMIHPSPVQAKTEGVLGKFDANELRGVTQKLHQDGFVVFDKKLSAADLDELIKFTRETPASLRRHDNDPVTKETRKAIYQPGGAQAVRYDYSAEDLMRNPVVQKLVSDPTILAVARSYLGAEPIIDIVTMWWHTDFQKQPDSNAAQLYHFDMDRVRWLKFFFYVTDVTEDSGPHCFIRGTHQAQNIPKPLLQKGYVRISDEEMLQNFKKEDFIEFCGPRGTIIAEDTCGFHKGKHVHRGDRLVFQLEFAVSMFGSPGMERFKVTDIRIPELSLMMKQNPRVYRNFESESHV